MSNTMYTLFTTILLIAAMISTFQKFVAASQPNPLSLLSFVSPAKQLNCHHWAHWTVLYVYLKLMQKTFFWHASSDEESKNSTHC